MASKFSSPSQSVSNFLLPQLEWSPTSEKISTTSAGLYPRIVLKKSMNKTDDVVSSVMDQALVATNGEESTKDETKDAGKRKRVFPTFSVSLGRGNIEADLLAMTGSNLSKRSAAKKKRTMSLQNSSKSSSTDNSADSMGSRYNLAVQTLMNEPTPLAGRRKIAWKFTAASDNKKNNDMVAINSKDQSQTLVSTELEETEKVKTRKNTRKVSNAANQTLIPNNGNEAESLPPESTQLGIAPLTKENGEKKKRIFSTFSVTLTREEVEADFLAMGGSMRTKRIKKRPKNMQRQLDDLFPGLRLKYRTLNDYRVREDKN